MLRNSFCFISNCINWFFWLYRQNIWNKKVVQAINQLFSSDAHICRLFIRRVIVIFRLFFNYIKMVQVLFSTINVLVSILCIRVTETIRGYQNRKFIICMLCSPNRPNPKQGRYLVSLDRSRFYHTVFDFVSVLTGKWLYNIFLSP